MARMVHIDVQLAYRMNISTSSQAQQSWTRSTRNRQTLDLRGGTTDWLHMYVHRLLRVRNGVLVRVGSHKRRPNE